MRKNAPTDLPAPSEGYAPVKNARLYYRDAGRGLPVLVLHGGPDFDHSYLLPDLDRLSRSFRLIYYDQRGRGKSGENVQPEQVSLQSEMEDLEGLREYFHLESAVILGHSWGGLLAMEYALRYPHRVTHLVLMNTAPASHDDLQLFRQERRKTTGDDVLDKMKALAATGRYQAGDPEADAEYYRFHFRATLRRPENLEKVVKSLRVGATPEGIRKARAIEERLYADTWSMSSYSLFPRLSRLAIPTLLLHGAYDFIPIACAEHIAQAIPGARLVVLDGCGHFSYLECPEKVYQEIAGLLEQP